MYIPVSVSISNELQLSMTINVSIVIYQNIEFSFHIIPKVSNISNGERPTTVDIYLYSSTTYSTTIVDTVTNVQLANVTHSNVLTVTNILTLQQDHYYTVIASFSNVGGDFTTDSIATLSKTLLLLLYYYSVESLL